VRFRKGQNPAVHAAGPVASVNTQIAHDQHHDRQDARHCYSVRNLLARAYKVIE
jgi:hypothetical protein